jgi:hypothetical protein
MQNIRQTYLSRYSLKARETIETLCYGLKPEAIYQRFVGPRMLLNSVPKAGTNLLLDVMHCWPQFQRRIGRTLRGWHEIDNFTEGTLASIRRGQYAPAHLPFSEEIRALLLKHEIRTVTVIRDPRDVYLSAALYMAHMDTTHPGHAYFASLKNDSARIDAALRGVPGVISPLAETLEKFSGWLTYPQGLIVRFEDLVGSHESRAKALESMAIYFGVPFNAEILRTADRYIGKPGNLTFRSGKAGQWRDSFNANQIELVNRSAGHLIKLYGYDA